MWNNRTATLTRLRVWQSVLTKINDFLVISHKAKPNILPNLKCFFFLCVLNCSSAGPGLYVTGIGNEELQIVC